MDQTSKRDITASLAASFGVLVTGFTLGYSSPVMMDLQKEEILDNSNTGLFASLFYLGAMFGSIFAGSISNQIGRKATLLLCCLPEVVGWFLIVSASNATQLIIGRFLTGASGAMRLQSISVYNVEMAVKSRRGALSSLLSVLANVGILLIYVFGLFLSWRWVAVVAIFVTLMSVFFVLPWPDTPRWYLLKGRRSEAIGVLSWLYKRDNIDDDLKEIEENLQMFQSSGWHTLFDKHLKHQILLSVYIMMMNQLSGKYVLVAYQNKIFADVGFSRPDFPSIFVASVSAASTIASSFIVDRMGRRPLYIIAGAILSVSLLLLGVCFYLDTAITKWIGIVFFVIYNIGYAASWGTVSLLTASEIYPLKSRGAGAGLGLLSFWLSGFILTLVFPQIEALIHEYGMFWIFGILCVIATIVVPICMPETKGKSLEEIELYFAS